MEDVLQHPIFGGLRCMICGSQLWIARYASVVDEAFFYAAVAYAQGISDRVTSQSVLQLG